VNLTSTLFESVLLKNPDVYFGNMKGDFVLDVWKLCFCFGKIYRKGLWYLRQRILYPYEKPSLCVCGVTSYENKLLNEIKKCILMLSPGAFAL